MTVLRYLVLLLVVYLMPAVAEDEDLGAGRGDTTTAAPYFYAPGGDGQDDFLLKSSTATAKIAGAIADVTVTQQYSNNGTRPIEAIYVFPGSTRAAVSSLTMKIGERVIKADIKERDAARQAYENARITGFSASLLEQHRPNVFQMSVANILPGDTITVELSYTELLVPTHGVYQFIYPTVVGPRYHSPLEKQGESWFGNPYLSEGHDTPSAFSLDVSLQSGMPIRDVRSPSHAIDAVFETDSLAKVTLAPAGGPANNRDFVLEYRLADQRIEAGLLLSRGEKGNHFLAMVEPPAKPTAEETPPRDYIFVMDVSGSMNGFPLGVSKAIMRDLLASLRPNDTFNIVQFAGSSAMLATQSVPATPRAVQAAIAFVDMANAGGGTELLPALTRAFALPKEENVSRSLVILSDGYVSVEAEAFRLIEKNLGKANVFAFGIGAAVNRYLMEGLALAGRGESFIALNEDEGRVLARRFVEYVKTPVLTGISWEADGFEVSDVEPASLPDLFAERPIMLYGRWTGEPKGKIVITGHQGSRDVRLELDVSSARVAGGTDALGYLWARKRIERLSDYSTTGSVESLPLAEEQRRDVTALALRYGLLTRFTSFVAVDSVVRSEGVPVPVTQPLPLAQSVSNFAVGGPAGPGANVQGYSEASYEDNLVRGAVGNVFRLFEGAFGLVLMLAFFSLAGVLFARAGGRGKRWSWAGASFLALALITVMLRVGISLFFGPPFEVPASYEIGGSP